MNNVVDDLNPTDHNIEVESLYYESETDDDFTDYHFEQPEPNCFKQLFNRIIGNYYDRLTNR